MRVDNTDTRTWEASDREVGGRQSPGPDWRDRLRRYRRINSLSATGAAGRQAAADVLLGAKDLTHACAIVQALTALGLTCRVDIGQQGMPATVRVRLPPGRPGCSALVRAVTQFVDPSSRRLARSFRRRSSVRVLAGRHAARTQSRHDIERLVQP
jgi:hypothetical protein